MVEMEITPNALLDRYLQIYDRPLTEAKASARHGREISPFSHESPVRYTSKETLPQDAHWLDRIELASIEEGMTGPQEGLHDQITYLAAHINGAIQPEDRSVFYGIKSKGEQLGGYVQTYRPTRADRRLARETVEQFITRGRTEVEPIGRYHTVREVSMFREGSLPDDVMIHGLRDALTLDALRFANKNDGTGVVFVAFEQLADEGRENVLKQLGFINVGEVRIKLEVPDPSDSTQTIEEDDINNVWILTSSQHLKNLQASE